MLLDFRRGGRCQFQWSKMLWRQIVTINCSASTVALLCVLAAGRARVFLYPCCFQSSLPCYSRRHKFSGANEARAWSFSNGVRSTASESSFKGMVLVLLSAFPLRVTIQETENMYMDCKRPQGPPAGSVAQHAASETQQSDRERS